MPFPDVFYFRWNTVRALKMRQALPMLILHRPALALAAGLMLWLGACRPAPRPLPPVQPGQTVYFIPNTNRMLALTFDDGPNGAATEKILDTLKHFKVPATFFLVGTNVTRYPELARRAVREGHVIGNHSFSHPRFDQIGMREMIREIRAGGDAIAAATGARPVWFRPPFGINGLGLAEACAVEGCAIAGWSGAAGDWNRRCAVEIAESMITQSTPGDILVLHDGFETRPDADRQATVDAVYLILERLTREGFRFVTLPELSRHAGPPLAEFAGGVRLLGLHLQEPPPGPGDVRYIRYFWDLPAGWDPRAFSAFVHFESGGRRIQNDHPLPAQDDVRDRAVERVLIIPTNALPGKYQGRIGLFDPARPAVRHRAPVRAAELHRKGAVILPDFLEVKERPRPAGDEGK